MLAAAPSWADMLTGIGSIIGGLSLVLAAGYGAYQVGEIRRGRQVEVIADLGRRWDSDGLIDARKRSAVLSDVKLAEMAKRWDEDPQKCEDFYYLLRVPNFLDDLGLVAECGSIDLGLVNRSMRVIVLEQWAKWERAVKTLQAREPSSFRQFERLARDLHRLESPR